MDTAHTHVYTPVAQAPSKPSLLHPYSAVGGACEAAPCLAALEPPPRQLKVFKIYVMQCRRVCFYPAPHCTPLRLGAELQEFSGELVPLLSPPVLPPPAPLL